MRLDAHQHFWHYNPAEHVWMTDEYDVLRRDYTPDDLARLLEELSFDGSIAVQAREMAVETEWLLSLADRHPFIRGVVGWVDLCSTDVERDLAKFAAHPTLRGMRMVIHDRPEVDFAISPAHRRGVGLLAKYGLTYDLLLRPPHLRPAMQLADNFPDQKFVVDHLAKPEIRHRRFSPWREDITELARRPNVFCKLSGVVTEADWYDWKAEDLHPFLDLAADAFGARRLMIGSDWPVCLCAASYPETMAVALEWARGFSRAEQAAIFGGNCARFYGIRE